MGADMTDYYTDADHIRDTLDKHGPLTRAKLADKTNLPRETLAKSLYALKKQGDVIEEGDRLMLTKAPETAQDAPEDAETGIGSTTGVESGTGQEYDYYAPANAATESVKALADAYAAANVMLIALRAENEKLRKENEQFRRKYAQTEDFSGKYIALKQKLRGLLDE